MEYRIDAVCKEGHVILGQRREIGTGMSHCHTLCGETAAFGSLLTLRVEWPIHYAWTHSEKLNQG